MTLTAEADALAVVDARRYVDLERSLLDHAAAAVTDRARMLDVTPRAAARRAGLRADELTEHAARHLAQPARAAARGTGRRLRPRLGAVAGAARTRDGDLERDLARRTGRGLDELDFDASGDVCATAARRSARHAE